MLTEEFVDANKDIIWRRAMLLARGDKTSAETYAVEMFVEIDAQMKSRTFKSVHVSAMRYMERKLMRDKSPR